MIFQKCQKVSVMVAKAKARCIHHTKVPKKAKVTPHTQANGRRSKMILQYKKPDVTAPRYLQASTPRYLRRYAPPSVPTPRFP